MISFTDHEQLYRGTSSTSFLNFKIHNLNVTKHKLHKLHHLACAKKAMFILEAQTIYLKSISLSKTVFSCEENIFRIQMKNGSFWKEIWAYSLRHDFLIQTLMEMYLVYI